MTPLPTEKPPIFLSITGADRQIAGLATAAIGLSLLDAAIPTPLPGVKPGLANIVTLLVLARYGWGTAAWVTGLRVFAISLLLGQFLTPGFFLSIAGAICSLLILGLGQYLPRRWFGMVSWSLLAAFAHIGGQLILARLWLIPHDGLYHIIPIFSLTALISGTLNGLIASHLQIILDSPLEATPAS
jgi:heptaprenyl diphosphate synthase